jgi:hypothetical protein
MKLKLNTLLMLTLAAAISSACSNSDQVQEEKRPKLKQLEIANTKADEEVAKNLDRKIKELEAKLAKTENKNEEILDTLEDLHSERNALAPKLVSFSKDLLDKDLLLHITEFSSTVASNPYSFKSKVVNLKIVGNELIVVESLTGKLQSDNIPTEKLELVLPILNNTDSEIKVDFSSGLKSLSGTYYVGGAESGTEIVDSYLKAIKTYDDKGLMIDVVARYNTGTRVGVESIVYKMTFEELKENKNFTPLKSSALEAHNIRFFKTSPIWEPGKRTPFAYAEKWDISKTVPFHYSQNFPEEFLGHLKSSFTYWNTLFGKEVLTLEKLPDGVVANDRGYNVVQWLSWDAAGSARADFKSNPRTGELLQATLHITSVFAKTRGREHILSEILNVEDQNGNNETSFLKSAGHENHIGCNQTNLEDIKRSIKEVDLKKYSDEELGEIEKELVKLYLTETIAHEIGHALGLRHNFASSAQSELNATDYDAQMKEFIENGKLLNENIGTSTMEYARFWDSVMSGFKVYTNQPLPYDQKAIKYAYNGIPEKPSKEEQALLFCSDEEADRMIDNCRRFDRYENKIIDGFLSSVISAEKEGKNLVDLINAVLEGKNEEKINKALATLNPSVLGARYFSWYLKDLLISLDSRTTLLGKTQRETAAIKQAQIKALPNNDGAVFYLISSITRIIEKSAKEAIQKLPEATEKEIKNKETVSSFIANLILNTETILLRESTKALSNFSYKINDVNSYKSGLSYLSNYIMKTPSGLELLETKQEDLEVIKPLFDYTSGNTLRLDYVTMLATKPPLYNKDTFKILMADFKDQLTEELSNNIENKFEKGLMLEPSNLNIMDQLAVEKKILEILNIYW